MRRGLKWSSAWTAATTCARSCISTRRQTSACRRICCCGKTRRPAIVALHDHSGFYVWGKEKLVELDNEHPSLTEFKRRSYSGRSYASELARRGYVVIVIDMFYWGERRMLLADDPPAWRESAEMSMDDVTAFNRRCSTSATLIATGLFEAGVTWSGVMFLDDIRTVDYLVTRPEVDPERIGCCGLSVRGSTHEHRLLENAPGALMVLHGTKDKLFTNAGVQAAFDKIAKVYKKAGAPHRFESVTYDGPHEFNAEMQAEGVCLSGSVVETLRIYASRRRSGSPTSRQQGVLRRRAELPDRLGTPVQAAFSGVHAGLSRGPHVLPGRARGRLSRSVSAK